MAEQLKITVHYMCILGVILDFYGCMYLRYLWEKNRLFTEIKRTFFREISVFLLYIFLHKL